MLTHLPAGRYQIEAVNVPTLPALIELANDTVVLNTLATSPRFRGAGPGVMLLTAFKVADSEFPARGHD